MIATLTLNPCIDRTVTVETFHYGETNRAAEVRTDICGKGINVSVALKNLGADTKCFGFSYQEDRGKAEGFLESMGIPWDFIEVQGSLRVNLKIFDVSKKILTEVNEKGTPVNEKAVNELLKKADSIFDEASVFVLSGSVPPGVPENIYRMFIERANEKGTRTILDASGVLLREGIKGKPYLIKPNMEKLEELFQKKFTDNKQIIEASRALLEEGITYVCVSMGSKGAFLTGREGTLFAPALPLEVRGIQGAGDSLVAGMCLALEEGENMENLFRSAVAAAGGSLLGEGTQLCGREDYERLFSCVEIVSVI